MAAHKDIRILFAIKNGEEERHYEAVGFLNEGERGTDGDTMLARIDGENGGAIGGEDVDFISKHLNQLPTGEGLQRKELVTSQRCWFSTRYVVLFTHDYCWHRKDDGGGGCLNNLWEGENLVLRRLSPQ